MREDLDKSENSGDMPPRPSPGFETDVLRELEALVLELRPGATRLRIGRVPSHPEWPELYFEVMPTNPKAARFEGIAVGRDLDLTIGHSWREFYGFARGGTIVRGAAWQEEFRWIWQAVIAGGFVERRFLDCRGNVIAWDSKLVVNGKAIVFRNGRREKLFGRAYTREEIVTYEPYF